jgi:hypothetical protein
MALEINDLMALQSMDKSSMTPYEQYKVGYMQQKHHTSGIGVAGLVLGTVGTAAAVGAWIFGPMYGNAKANQAKEVANSAKELANVQIAASQRQIDQLTNLFAAERAERIAGDVTLTNTVNDSVSGSQQSALTAQQAAEFHVCLGFCCSSSPRQLDGAVQGQTACSMHWRHPDFREPTSVIMGANTPASSLPREWLYHVGQ